MKQRPPRSHVVDVILGCVTAIGDQGGNIGKIASLCAGWGEHISGAAVNRFCCSGLDATNLAAAKVHAPPSQAWENIASLCNEPEAEMPNSEMWS